MISEDWIILCASFQDLTTHSHIWASHCLNRSTDCFIADKISLFNLGLFILTPKISSLTHNVG